MQDAFGVVARARGMTNVARKSGLGRESLYKALRPNSQPSFNTIMRVADALDAELYSLPKHKRLPTSRGGDASHKAVKEFRHIDPERHLRVLVRVLHSRTVTNGAATERALQINLQVEAERGDQ